MLDLTNIAEVSGRVQGRATKVLGDFRGFVFKQNILALAIAVIIGTATNNVVQATIKDLLMPVVNLAIPDQSWTVWGPTIGKREVPVLDAKGNPVLIDGQGNVMPPEAKGGKIKTIEEPIRLLLGDLLWQFSNLLLIGGITYVMSRYLLRPPPPAPPGPPTRVCPSCLENVVVPAKVCKFCTRDLPPPVEVASGSPTA